MNLTLQIVLNCAFQWARDEFEGTFRQSVETAQQYKTDPLFMERVVKMPGTEPVSPV